MKIAYDFHIHTAASPCADDQMTPHNIVNMAKLKELEAIAITDHQTCINCEAVIQIGREKGLLVIPGIEIECREEIHFIALFKDLKVAKQIESYIQEHMPLIKNRTTLFGHQYQMNKEDEVVGEIERLLLIATQISAAEMIKKVRDIGGVIYPAHIDRPSYSILSQLGNIPDYLNLKIIEISQKVEYKTYVRDYADCTIIQSSDAHYLQDILERTSMLEVKHLTISEIFSRFQHKNIT